MTTTTHTDDLAQIVSGIDAKISEIDIKVNRHTERLAELQNELQSIARNKQNYAGDLEHTRTMVSQAQAACATAETDYTLAKKTSLEAQKKAELAEAKAQLERAQAQLQALQASFEHDSQAEADTGAAVLETQHAIAALVTQKQEIAATRERFSREQANHIRTLGLEMLNEIDSEIASLQAKLDQARSYREDALRKLARDLSPCPQMCVSTLSEVGTFDDASPDARLLSAWLSMLEALDKASPNAQRMALFTIPLRQLVDCGGLQAYRESQERAKITHGAQHGGAVIADPALQKLEKHIVTVEDTLKDLHRAEQELQARRLIAEVMQTSS